MEAKRQIWIHHGESATLWIGGVARWQRERVCVYYLFPSKPNGTLTFVGTRNKLIERERRMLYQCRRYSQGLYGTQLSVITEVQGEVVLQAASQPKFHAPFAPSFLGLARVCPPVSLSVILSVCLSPSQNLYSTFRTRRRRERENERNSRGALRLKLAEG